VLGLFTFLWFFVVPMPGLLVFNASGGYRVSMSLPTSSALPSRRSELSWQAVYRESVARALGALRLGGEGLVASIKGQYEAFQSMAVESGRLTPAQIPCSMLCSLIFKLFWTSAVMLMPGGIYGALKLL
jgi:hypothetical protein